MIAARVSLLHGSNLPTIPSPITCRRPAIPVWFLDAGLPREFVFSHLVISEAFGVLGFTFGWQARHDDRPNRVHLRYGLAVLLAMLSTPPLGDAVSFGYEVQTNLDRDFHPASSTHSQAH